jgi:N-acetylmuramoyl-L-alanine amidase
MSKTVLPIFDAGHGGIINGHYVTAPKKMYKHKDGTVAYEGVINRKIKNKCVDICREWGMPYFDVTPGEEDYALGYRVEQANKIYHQQKEEFDVVYTSIHCNAGKGTGLEVYTTPGETESDKYATLWIEEMKKLFLNHRFRMDYTDGDPDKEALFKVLRETHCPAVLGEFFFFDNYDDWVYMQTDDFINKAAQSVINMVKRKERGD